MKMPKLWILDIDGTCNEPVFQVLKQYQDLGHFVTFATGRGYLRTMQALAGFKPNAPLILEDGGRILAVTGNNIKLNQLSGKEILSIKDVVSLYQKKIDLVVFYPLHDQKMHFLSFNDNSALMISQLKSIKGMVSQSINQFFCWAEAMGCVMITAIAKGNSDLKIPQQLSWARAAGEYNFHPKGISKATGVNDILSLLNLSYDDAVIIGNDDNDKPMFELPVAMKIAVGGNNELQKLATHSVKTPDELAELLKKIKRS